MVKKKVKKLTKIQEQIKELKDAKKLIIKANSMLKNYDSIIYSEMLHAPFEINELIDAIKKIMKDLKEKGN